MMIKFENIRLQYNEKVVFKDFSLEIKRGEKVVLLGKSGLGKSSLFSLILGFVQPQQGKVFVDGVDIDDKTVWDARRRIAFVDQDVSMGTGKVAEWFDFVSGLKAAEGLDFSKKRIEELFHFFEFEGDVCNSYIESLSGGERQRLAIITSVLLGRDVFLLDEVTAGLDKHLKEKTAEFFIREKAWTVAVISHDAVWLDHPEMKIFDVGAKKWIR